MKKKSWETTTVGAITGLMMILNEVKDLLDNDPTTIFELPVVIAGIGVIVALWRARDNNKRSERVGAK